MKKFTEVHIEEWPCWPEITPPLTRGGEPGLLWAGARCSWANTGVNTAMDVKGRDTLATNLFDAAKADNAKSDLLSPQYTDYMKASWATADTNNITKAVFVTGSGPAGAMRRSW